MSANNKRNAGPAKHPENRPMACFLAGLNAQTDMVLGPLESSDNGRIVHHYTDREHKRGQVIVVGALAAVVDRKNEPKVLVLNVPKGIKGSFPVIRSIFRRQLEILDNILHRERAVVERFVINQELWSQGPTEGNIYIRVSDETRIDTFDLSGKPDHPFNILHEEVQITPHVIAPVPNGSILMCYALPFRADVPEHPSPSPTTLFARSYGLHASHIVQLYRTE
ncbi:hypothetical protein C8R47DRAFT_1219713 [Mycena vitilis]|nr:hypothetical protein C8R47DRAFT_1219713 [Mycena vitilis]